MHLLTISGSLQDSSANGSLLDLVAASASASASTDDTVTRSVSVGDVPHFRPDRDDPGAAVTQLREQIAAADAVMIASPEYAHSLPGSLKNALDWIVGSGELYDKPVVVACATHATNHGALGRAALEQTLRAQGAIIVDSRSVAPGRAAQDVAEILEIVRSAIAAGPGRRGPDRRPTGQRPAGSPRLA